MSNSKKPVPPSGAAGAAGTVSTTGTGAANTKNPIDTRNPANPAASPAYAAAQTGRINESAAYIRERLGGAAPEIAVVLGSGLGGFADQLQNAVVIPYRDIPHFPRSTAPGHKGNIVVGEFTQNRGAPSQLRNAPPQNHGARILCMQGRFHLYEGYTMSEATYHIRVMRALGVKKLILTNASGGMEPMWQAGELMLILDHINFMGQNPLVGPNLGEFGPRFPDMTYAYDPQMRDVARRAASELSIRLREGVYVGFTGPSYETPAEIRMFRALGASAVGMSTVPETIVANHCGIKVCGISCITNLAAGILDQPLTEGEVIETAGRSGPVFESLIQRTVELLSADESMGQ
ncbi:MAG: purine-nucleoside phosphorylase [Clostridiales bacterium]|jgi:purine-nucleoside phosphorylase|nr:purine-nucleoside phosphorylase [Clostridiales bacterium]